jgi:hypothetical protein
VRPSDTFHTCILCLMLLRITRSWWNDRQLREASMSVKSNRCSPWISRKALVCQMSNFANEMCASSVNKCSDVSGGVQLINSKMPTPTAPKPLRTGPVLIQHSSLELISGITPRSYDIRSQDILLLTRQHCLHFKPVYLFW